MRHHNLALALGLVVGSPTPVSRSQLAAASGLTRATSSTLAETLIGGGLLREVLLPPTARSGRPATGLQLAADGPGGLGLAIEVDHLSACVVDLSGTVRSRVEVASDQRGGRPRDVVRRVAGLAVRVVEQARLPLAGATVAVPGLVEPDGRRVLRAPNLGWRDVPVLDLLARHPLLTEVPLGMDNEADVAALAEIPHSTGDFVYLSGGVGVGAGIVLAGRLHRGRRGWSGELGHLTVDRRGPLCSCGARGCLEQYVGYEALLRRAGLPVPPSIVRSGDRGRSGDPAVTTGRSSHSVAPTGRSGDPAVPSFAELAAAGRRPVLSALEAAGHALGVVLAGVVNLLDLDEIVLGGSLAPVTPWLLPGIEAELNRHVLWSGLGLPVVRGASGGPDAVVLGAALASTQALLADPAAWLGRRP